MVRADAITPADILGVLWRYRLAGILLAIAGAAGAYGYSLTLADQFTATTLVLVEGEKLDSAYVRGSVSVDLEARLRTLREKVLSRTNLQAVMDRFGLETDASTWEERLDRMRSRIAITVTRTDAFAIEFTDSDPERARDVTNALAQLFIDDSRGAIVRQSEDAAALFDQRLEEVGAELQAREQQIADFKSRNRGSLPTQVSATMSTLEYAKTQLSTTTADLAAARDRRARLERVSKPVTSNATPPGARQLAQQLLYATSTQSIEERISSQPAAVRLEVRRLQRDSLLKRFTAMHPDVRLLDAEIASLEAEAAAAGPEAMAVAIVTGDQLLIQDLADAEREVRRLEGRRSDLQRQISDYEALVNAAPRVEQQLSDLERQYDGLATEYRDLRDRLGAATLAAGTMSTPGETGFKVLDPAVTPESKSSPQRSIFFIAGALVGLGLAYCAAFAYEIVAQPLYGPAEIERHLGVPVLSAIPVVVPARTSHGRRRLGVSGVVLGVAAAGVTILRLLA